MSISSARRPLPTFLIVTGFLTIYSAEIILREHVCQMLWGTDRTIVAITYVIISSYEVVLSERSVCLSLCLSICLLVTLRNTDRIPYEKFTRDVSVDKKKNWLNFGFRFWIQYFLKAFNFFGIDRWAFSTVWLMSLEKTGWIFVKNFIA